MLGKDGQSQSIFIQLIKGFGELVKYIFSKVWSYTENF